MKITDIRTHILEFQLEKPMWSSIGFYESRQMLLVEVHTDTGLVGWGEAAGLPSASANVIDDVLCPMFLGRDPTDINVLWHEAYMKTRHYGQKGIAIAAISGVDIALWDILGKYWNAPVHKLLGGAFRQEINAYSTGLFYHPGETLEDLQRSAELLVRDKGYKAIKMKVGGVPWSEDSRRIAAVRDAIGPDALLMVDSNCAFNAAAAVTIGREMSRHNVFWFEEPVPPEDIEGYCSVKAALPILIAGGEREFTRFGFRRLFDMHAVDIVQPETCRAGGITECRRIADQAFLAGVFYVPHMHGSAIALAASVQLVTALPPVSIETGPNPPQIEVDTTHNPLQEQLLVDPLQPTNGLLRVPSGPGLGIEINRTTLEKYRI